MKKTVAKLATFVLLVLFFIGCGSSIGAGELSRACSMVSKERLNTQTINVAYDCDGEIWKGPARCSSNIEVANERIICTGTWDVELYHKSDAQQDLSRRYGTLRGDEIR